MGFWVRNIIFGCILIGLAAYFFTNQDLMNSIEQDAMQEAPTTEQAEKIDTVAAPKPAPKKEEEKQNKAAKGISSFYANILGELGENGPTIRNNIVYLPEQTNDLELLLDNRMQTVRAYPKRWSGTTESRPFRKDETIFQKLAEFAKKDKLEVFWRLNKDFVVKDAFRINKNILKTALQLGQGIDGHFQEGVSVYFCYKSRSIVFIEGTKSYLDERCTLIQPKRNY